MNPVGMESQDTREFHNIYIYIYYIYLLFKTKIFSKIKQLVCRNVVTLDLINLPFSLAGIICLRSTNQQIYLVEPLVELTDGS